MRRISFITFFLIALVFGCDKAPTNLSVKNITDPMPSGYGGRTEFIDKYRDMEPRNDNSVSAHNWEDQYESFSHELIKKASRAKLDSAGLSKVLQVIFEDGERKNLVYLPVEACAAKWDDKAVWIVYLRWEYKYDLMRKSNTLLEHSREYVFTQDDLKQIYFNTCK